MESTDVNDWTPKQVKLIERFMVSEDQLAKIGLDLRLLLTAVDMYTQFTPSGVLDYLRNRKRLPQSVEPVLVEALKLAKISHYIDYHRYRIQFPWLTPTGRERLNELERSVPLVNHTIKATVTITKDELEGHCEMATQLMRESDQMFLDSVPTLIRQARRKATRRKRAARARTRRRK